MTTKAYRIAELQELLNARHKAATKQKKTAKVAESAQVKTSEKEVCSDKPETNILESDSLPMPKTLEGMSCLDILLAFYDGTMSPEERLWFQKRESNRLLNPQFPGDLLAWMGR